MQTPDDNASRMATAIMHAFFNEAGVKSQYRTAKGIRYTERPDVNFVTPLHGAEFNRRWNWLYDYLRYNGVNK